MISAELLTEVKQALRVVSDAFNTEINTLIEACKLDLSIAGITALDETDPLIKRSIVLYVKAHFGYDNADSEKFQKSYDLLKMSLAIVSDYGGRQ